MPSVHVTCGWSAEGVPLEPHGFGAGKMQDQADRGPTGQKRRRVPLIFVQPLDDRQNCVALLVEECWSLSGSLTAAFPTRRL